MSSKYKFLMVMLGLLVSSNANSYYKPLSPASFDALYSLAAHGNVSALNHAISRGLNINSVNKDGDTGLCIAAKRHDKKAFKSFIQAGANPSHPCTWEIRGYRDFMEQAVYDAPKKMDTATNAKELVEPGMSWKTKTLIGTGVVAAGAGVALALGGGGGGGSDNKLDPNCVFGYYEGDKCECYNGYTGDNCNDCAENYDKHYTNNCHLTLDPKDETNEEIQKLLGGKNPDNVEQFGNTFVCKKEYTGDTCDDCAKGYGRNSLNACVELSAPIYGNDNQNTNANKATEIEVESSATAYQHLYGMFYDAEGPIGNLTLLKNKMTNSYNLYALTPYDGNKLKYGSTTITVNQLSDGDAYGMYSKNAEEIYNNYTIVEGKGSLTKINDEIKATISVKSANNVGNGDVYGIWGNNKIYSIYFSSESNANIENLTLKSEINITSNGTGNAYGIYNPSAQGEIYNLNESLPSSSLISKINVTGTNSGNVYGIYGYGKIENSGDIIAKIDENKTGATGSAYGIYNKGGSVRHYGQKVDSGNYTPQINVSSGYGKAFAIYTENSTVSNENLIYSKSFDKNGYGIYAINSEVTNSSGISANSQEADAYGIYNKGGKVVNTTQSHEINVTSEMGTAYGIYSDGGIVENSGKITVNGNVAYGIYATNRATVYNTGNYEIIVNGHYLSTDNENAYCNNSSGCKMADNAYAIYLTGGAKLVNEGSISSTSVLSLPQGTQIGTGGSYSSEVQISGNLDVASKTVSQGFENTYTLNNAVETPDASGLKISSESVLFDASLQGNDIILNKKGFDKLVDNKDVAKFLEQNYAQENNEHLFAALKSATNVKELNKLTDTLTGQDIISRFADEDLIMSRELDFDMNEKLFNLPAGKFSLANDISTKIFDDTGSRTSYALSGIELANAHLGVGLAIQEIVSSDANNSNARHSQNFQFMAPLQFKNKGFNTVVTPKLAYAYGTYDRNGYEGKNFEGTIEKQTASVSAQTRYPFKLFGLDFAPASEINLSAYQTKISEDAKDYALSSDDTTYSANFGMGAYLSSSKDWAKNHKLSFMAGAMLYHEFADPYELKMKINGMNGSFTLRDENRQDNYVVLRSKFDYTKDNFSLYGDFLSYADSKFRTRLDVGFKYHF